MKAITHRVVQQTLRHLRWLAPASLVVALSAGLGGCIDSAAPILSDAEPLLGEAPHLQFYAVRDGAAHEPSTGTFTFRDSRYVAGDSGAKEIGDFSLHTFEGADLLVQSIRPDHAVEYAIARKLAEGTYLVVPIDESDADEATRSKYCSTEDGAACRVTSREAVLAFARATAAKPQPAGGLALLMAEH